MSGAIESLVLSGLHKKAQAKDMDLNDPEEFKKFSFKAAQLIQQCTMTVEQIVERADCNCGKQPTRPETVGKITQEDIDIANKNRETKTGTKHEEHN